MTNFQTWAAQDWVSPYCWAQWITWHFLTEQAMDHNQDRITAFRENQTRTKILSKEVQHLQEEKSKQVRALTNPELAAFFLPSPCGRSILQASVPRLARAKVASWPYLLYADFTSELRANRSPNHQASLCQSTLPLNVVRSLVACVDAGPVPDQGRLCF